jgi:hypothetical protein
MRATLVKRLEARGIALPDSVFAGAGQLLDEQLGDELANYVFGRQTQIQRQLARDPQVKEAIALLARATSPAELFTLAARTEKSPAH